MTTLYKITSSRGKVNASVRAVPAPARPLLNGIPDPSAVREALPHYWRKAFDRAEPWECSASPGNLWVILKNSRGFHLTTLWAQAYDFTPGEAKE